MEKPLHHEDRNTLRNRGQLLGYLWTVELMKAKLEQKPELAKTEKMELELLSKIVEAISYKKDWNLFHETYLFLQPAS